MSRPVKSERDKIAAKARKMCRDPMIAISWREAWDRVLNRLATVYHERRPIMKSFEVHHSNERAREEMLRALVAGKSINESEELAVRSVT